MEIKSLPVQNEDGDLVPGSSATVYHMDSGDVATIYDRAGGIISNPITAGADGIIEFAAENGPYRVMLTIGIQQYERFLYFSDIQEHNHNPSAHPELSAFITSEADRAEQAADAAAASGNIYSSTAAGLSATIEGDYFSVPSADADEYLILYLHEAGPVATEIKRYPSAEAVQALGYGYGGASAFVTTGFIGVDGVRQGSASWRCTDFLPILEGETYTVLAQASTNAYQCWYDADQVFISSFRESSSSSIVPAVAVAPAGARYIRLSTRDIAVSGSSISAPAGSYRIEQVVDIIEQHARGITSAAVTYSSDSVEYALDSIIANQTVIVARQSDLYNRLELSTDAESPFFVPSWLVTKRYGGGSTDVYTIASRDSDSQLELSADPGVGLPVIVVRDEDTGKHIPFVVDSISGATVIVLGVLPATIAECMQIHDSPGGQHLTEFGYKALAEFMVDRVQRYSYKKADGKLFEYHPPSCSTTSYAQSSILSADKSEVLIPVTRLPGTGVGSTLSNGQPRLCQTSAADVNITAAPECSYLSRRYEIAQEVAGAGIEFSCDAQSLDGFVEIWFSAVKDANFSGDGRIEIIGDGSVTLLDKAIVSGSGLQVEYVDFTGVATITFRLSLAASVPTRLLLNGVYGYQKSPKTPTSTLFKNGDVIAFLGDSWVGFYGKTLQTRTQEYLSDNGVEVSTVDCGRGSQTSAWGLYWVDRVIEASPRPTHCVVLFGINDSNSISFYEDDEPSSYDFDPEDPMVSLPFDQGGVKGSTDPALWFENIRSICRRLSSAGIKPIVMMPAHTSSSAQTSRIRNDELGRIAAGF